MASIDSNLTILCLLVQALLLACAYNVPDILPTAFYDLYLSFEVAEDSDSEVTPTGA